MSERKVLTKVSRRCVLEIIFRRRNLLTDNFQYYPPDFDPRDISRKRGPKQSGPRVQAVRIMAPFSCRCLTCGGT